MGGQAAVPLSRPVYGGVVKPHLAPRDWGETHTVTRFPDLSFPELMEGVTQGTLLKIRSLRRSF